MALIIYIILYIINIAVILGDVADHPGKEMSCKVKLSINWCVAPTLACGHKRLTVS